MAVPFVGSPEAAYASKVNIKFPGTSAQATAAESAAQTKINDRLKSTVQITVSSGAISVAS